MPKETSSTQQQTASPLQQLFAGMGGYQGYQQSPLAQQITAPQYGGALTPSPEQAAQATVARMLARTPIAAPAPAAAPVKQKETIYHGNGSAGGRGSGGAW